ncbi:NAD-dependent epimerase/dehydratase [Sporodiniella umbellata]|nr:NAD-dependent epimerase/dehydratase [Sporodiniella umbellata]
MVKVAIIGASGKSGQLILKESLARGYQVTAIVRNKSKITQDVPIIEKEIQQLTRDDLESFDVVVNAFASSAGNESDHEVLGKKLIELLQGTNTRLIVVGGAGSLYVEEAKTTRLIDTKEVPKMYYDIAINMIKSFENLRASKDLKWTFFSPPAMFDPTGKRTGHYRLGEDHLLFNSENKPYISYADYALALVDEIEQANYVNRRFTAVSV